MAKAQHQFQLAQLPDKIRRMGKLKYFICGCLLAASYSYSAQGQILQKAREAWRSNDDTQAFKILQPLVSGEKGTTAEQNNARLLAGYLRLRNSQPEEARVLLEGNIKQSANLSPYSFYLLGDAYFQLQRFADAKLALERVDFFQPSMDLQYQARMLLGDVAMALGNWREAERQWIFLEKKWRRSSQYPEILWRHLLVTIKLKQRNQMCRLAKRIYAQYPAHASVYDWTFDLQNNRVQGERLGCIATAKEQSVRIRRLQLAGESARARQEIEQAASGGAASQERADMMLAQFLTNEGFPDEALKLIVKYYHQNERSVPYLQSLAMAAARGGEFQTAVGMYTRVFNLAPSSRPGREALFQAAYLSYLFQDFDGATRHFTNFIEKYSRSGLVKDARWHLAWIKYLRGDYASALSSLEQMQSSRGRRKQNLMDIKIIYWRAMCLAKLGRNDEAKELFAKIHRYEALGYYDLVANVREDRMPKPENQIKIVAQTVTRVPFGSGVRLTDADGVSPRAAELELETEAESQLPLNVEATAHPEPANDNEDGTAVVTEEVETPEVVEAVSAGEEEEEKIVITDFKDPKLKRRFDVAQDLMNMGLFDWAKNELYEVERRSRNPAYMKQLMKFYENIQSFHRVVAISENYFGNERKQHGISGAKAMWESSFPRAYLNEVRKYSSQFGIQEEVVWAIMRAESQFKPDVLSPVGAKGLMQIMTETGRQVSRILADETPFHPMSLLNPENNIRLGARYLARLAQRYNNSLPLLAAAYNAGPHRVDGWLANAGHLDMDEFIEHIPFLETRNYVKKVVRNYALYKAIYRTEKPLFSWLVDSVPVKVSGRPSPRESWD